MSENEPDGARGAEQVGLGRSSPDRGLIDAARRQAEEAHRRSGAPPLPGVGDGYSHNLNQSLDQNTAEEPFPVSIPGFEMIREIHRGGQGVVYLALQKSTRRRVAVKIMREGPFGVRADRARFEREVQILGQLQHPNIVNIHESGTTAGHYYFVMDYISGRPLDVYCQATKGNVETSKRQYVETSDEATERRSDGGDQYRDRQPITQSVKGKGAGVVKDTEARRLPIQETLRLFAKICDAVNAAHLRGVIHRDLKPSNIRIDDNGEPHVLDFGLAKFAFDSLAIDNRQSAIDNPPTLTGQFIGSLPWSSPEQAEGAHGKMDVRTDVYALGVILYHMLTGRFPYSVLGNMRDVLDNILNVDPIPPRGFRRRINDEVETIVLKCLQKERDRRYQSAGELARDVRRYLADEPLEAKRDSTWYLIRKSLLRHRAAAYTTVAFIVLVAGAVMSTSVLFFKARTEARKAEKINSFLQQMLAAPNPFEEKGPDVTVREVLDAASQTLQTDLTLEPSVQADVHTTLGKTYASVSLYDQASPHLRAALAIRRKIHGETHVEVAAGLHDLGALLLSQGDFAAAEPLLRAALALRRRLLGAENTEVAESLGKLGELHYEKGNHAEAVTFYRDGLAMRRRLQGEEHISVASDLNNLALCLLDKGDADAAVPMFRQALTIHRARLGNEHPFVAADLNNLGMVLMRQGDYAAAEPLFREALDMDRKRLGDEHTAVATGINNLAAFLYAKGDYKSAEPLAREALALRRKLHGEEHHESAQSLSNLASILLALGDYDEAEGLFRQAFDQYRKSLDPNHPAVAATMNKLARLLTEKGDYAQAEPLARGAVRLCRNLPDDQDPQLVSMSLNDLANLLTAKCDFAAAKPLFDEALALRRQALGEDHPHTAQSLNDVAHWHLRQSEPGESEPGAQATGPQPSEPGAEATGPAPSDANNRRASAHESSHLKEAESLYRQALEIRRKKLPSAHPDLATTMVGLATTLLKTKDQPHASEAESLLHEALEIRRKSLPEGDPRIASIQRMFDACRTLSVPRP